MQQKPMFAFSVDVSKNRCHLPTLIRIITRWQVDGSEQLRQYVERAQSKDEEIKALQLDKRDLYAEVKANGFDIKAFKQLLRLLAMHPDERETLDATVATYLEAVQPTAKHA